MPGGHDRALTYSSYLRLDELLDCQTPLSDGPEHDELLFIVIHQVYELWFKQLIHELRHLGRRLEAGDADAAMHTTRRVLTILKTVVAQIDVLETMTPLGFGSFRDRLESASGFQSAQFRELEAVLGRRHPSMLEPYAEGTPGHARIADAMSRPGMFDYLLRFLAARGHPVPGSALGRDVTSPCAADPDVQTVLIEVYRSDPTAAAVCERMVDMDEGIQEWRYRHVKMVERTIGAKPGTGGSAGVEYLQTTLFRPLFPDLWAIRSQL
ncbi:MAG: tryptophan 2,3-dioxygenase [Gaiellales bacterium]